MWKHIRLTATNTIAQPRRFMECVSMMHVSRDEATKHFEAGYPDAMGGVMNQRFPPHVFSYKERDHTMNDQYYDFASRQLRFTTPAGVHLGRFNNTLGNVQTGGTIVVTESIISPPFDCYSKVDKSKMPGWSPWKWMSPVIPNVDRLEIDIQFTKLDASLMYYFYGRGNAELSPPAMVIAPNGVAANLLLYWAEVNILPLWCIKALLKYLVAGTSLKLILLLYVGNSMNRIGESSIS